MSPPSSRTLILAAVLAAAAGGAAYAQGIFNPSQQPAPAAPAANPVCPRLEAQLAAIDNGNLDPARATQIKAAEAAMNRQQADLDRAIAQSRKSGCDGNGFFQLFTGQAAQCGPVNNQIQQMRGNLDRLTNDYQRAQAASGDQASQRQTVINALAQNNCGPQYRAAANQQRGFFDVIFGNNNVQTGGGLPDVPGAAGGGGGYRTLCVRTCDGYYYPVSFSTSPAHFRDDEEVCKRTCPATEVVLYAHRNPGEEVRQAVSISGKVYADLPNAFRYRQQYDPTCSCRQPGQSWADALSQNKDTTVERGDIVVTQDKAKMMSQPKADPRAPQPDAKRDPKSNPLVDASPASAPAADTPRSPIDQRSIRTVGPTPYPVR